MSPLGAEQVLQAAVKAAPIHVLSPLTVVVIPNTSLTASARETLAGRPAAFTRRLQSIGGGSTRHKAPLVRLGKVQQETHKRAEGEGFEPSKSLHP